MQEVYNSGDIGPLKTLMDLDQLLAALEQPEVRSVRLWKMIGEVQKPKVVKAKARDRRKAKRKAAKQMRRRNRRN